MNREHMLKNIHNMVDALDDAGLKKLMYELRGEEEPQEQEPKSDYEPSED